MPKYLIEREVPGVANLSQEELQAIAQTSNNVLKEMGAPYHWPNESDIFRSLR